MKLFERALYGDDREASLPETRRQAFFRYGKENALLLCLTSVLTSLFFLPSLLWLYSANYGKAQYVAALTAEEAASLPSYLISHATRTGAVLIPLLMLFFVGLSGSFTVVRRICFGERCTLRHFFSGIRENGARFLVFGFLLGVLLFALRFNLTWLSTDRSSAVALFGAVASVLLSVPVVSVLLFGAMETVVYRVKLSRLLRNAFLLTLGRFFPNLLMTGLVLLPFLLALLLPFPFQLLALSVLSLFYTGYAGLLWGCYCNRLFDLYINPSLGEEFIGRGLRSRHTEKDG